jgi:hypothetical protein
MEQRQARCMSLREMPVELTFLMRARLNNQLFDWAWKKSSRMG